MNQHNLPQSLLKELVRQAAIIHPASVLTIALDEGIVDALLAGAGIGKRRTSLVVTNEKTTRQKKNIQHISIERKKLHTLPFKNNTFDLVICYGVLEHLQRPEKALAELRRVTKHYGILSVPNEPKFRIANLLSGKDLMHAGNPVAHLQHWSCDAFELFVSKKFTVFTRKEPFPWVVLVGEKN